MCIKIIFLQSPNEGDYIKIINLHFFLNFCSKKQKYVEKRTTFKYSMYSVPLRGINRCPNCIKIIFLHSPNEGDYIKIINLHFFLLNFCSKKQKYVEKRTTLKYSMYSVFLRDINRRPMCIKIIFLHSPNEGDYIKIINLHFFLLNFCSKKQKYVEKRTTLKYSMYSVFLRGINRRPMCIKIIFLHSLNEGDYIKIINLHFFLLNFCSRNMEERLIPGEKNFRTW